MKQINSDILSTIILQKQKELADKCYSTSLSELEMMVSKTIHQYDNTLGRKTVSLSESISKSSYGIIAEFKRRSPSKGWINKEADIKSVVCGYEKYGASGISVLTDESFFGGCLEDLSQVRQAVDIPLLRKDFIISQYQLYEAKLSGANAILLIAASLNKEECKDLAMKAHELQLEVLLELHSEEELEFLEGSIIDYIDIIGINNRNLGSFHTDIENSYRMVEKLPDNIPLVSESGISSAKDIRQLKSAGFSGFLMGESFMKEKNPDKAFEKLMADLKDNML